ncbi:MAG TPA: hypothetical protein VGQ57_00820 [Polyangiaceae bacterium]|nr:hypothetical protein [Polyangiaceae bacterium]
MGTTESDAKEILGDWLRKYEPVLPDVSEQPSKAAAGIVHPSPA